MGRQASLALDDTGRYVVFADTGSNLVTGDTNGSRRRVRQGPELERHHAGQRGERRHRARPATAAWAASTSAATDESWCLRLWPHSLQATPTPAASRLGRVRTSTCTTAAPPDHAGQRGDGRGAGERRERLAEHQPEWPLRDLHLLRHQPGRGRHQRRGGHLCPRSRGGTTTRVSVSTAGPQGGSDWTASSRGSTRTAPSLRSCRRHADGRTGSIRLRRGGVSARVRARSHGGYHRPRPAGRRLAAPGLPQPGQRAHVNGGGAAARLERPSARADRDRRLANTVSFRELVSLVYDRVTGRTLIRRHRHQTFPPGLRPRVQR